MSEEVHLVATYGTLMSGEEGPELAGIAGRVRCIGPCIIRGILYELGEYPGLVEAGEGRVQGELAEVSAEALARMDAYEGCVPDDPDSLFLRRRVRLLEPPGLECWVYFYNRDVLGRRPIASGDWRAHSRAL